MENTKSRNVRALVNSVKLFLADENDISAAEKMDIYNRNIEPQYYQPCEDSVLDAITEAYYFGLGIGQMKSGVRYSESSIDHIEALLHGVIYGYIHTFIWLQDMGLDTLAADLKQKTKNIIKSLNRVEDVDQFVDETINFLRSKKSESREVW